MYAHTLYSSSVVYYLGARPVDLQRLHPGGARAALHLGHMCMYIYIYTHICMYMYTYTHIYTLHVYLYIYIYIYILYK